MRELLVRLAIKYHGSYHQIKKALKKQEDPGYIPLQQALTIVDEDYPSVLLQLKYPPFVLFWQGNKELLRQKMVAIVGSRNSCDYGIEATRRIARLIGEKYVIVSGMAKGIDAIAHCNSRKTVGVLGNGLDIHYPFCNDALYKYMKEYQLLITEYPLGTAPRKEHFPFRNRIMAALAEKVIVTQAREKSGTMVTVEEALDLGRDIYVVPYRLGDENGLGCNRLIQQGAEIIVL